jgi:phage protein U
MTEAVWGLLGQLKFKAADTPGSLSVSESESFAELPLIQAKPITQWVGSELRDLKMSWEFDYSWCNPAAKLKELQAMLTAHEPLTFSFGAGNFNGNYYLEKLDSTVQRTLPSGEITELGVSVQLKETLDEPKPVEEPAAANPAFNPLDTTTKQPPKRSPWEIVRI